MTTANVAGSGPVSEAAKRDAPEGKPASAATARAASETDPALPAAAQPPSSNPGPATPQPPKSAPAEATTRQLPPANPALPAGFPAQAAPAPAAPSAVMPPPNAPTPEPTTHLAKGGQVVPLKATPAPPVAAPTSVAAPVAGPKPLHSPAHVPPLKQPLPAPVRSAPGNPPATPAAIGPAVLRVRHYGIATTFVAFVLVPALLATLYLVFLARDQFVSNMSFSVRAEEFQSSLDLLGGITNLSGSGGKDIDILSEFIMSQEMVEIAAREVNLRAAFSDPWPMDFVFAMQPDVPVEDVVDHWERRVNLSVVNGLIRIKVYSYDPEISREINQVIFDASDKLVNALSDEARRDATGYSRQELAEAEQRLSASRQAVLEFRMRTQIVDPGSAAQSQLGMLNTLNGQLAEELIKLDLLNMQAQSNDPRVEESKRRIQAIQNRIDDEQSRFGAGGEGPGGEDYSTLFAEYERLAAERQFAEEAYRMATVSNKSAEAEAQRKSRYIVAHVPPTLAETSIYPDRPELSLLSLLIAALVWSMGVLIYYSIRDRR